MMLAVSNSISIKNLSLESVSLQRYDLVLLQLRLTLIDNCHDVVCSFDCRCQEQSSKKPTKSIISSYVERFELLSIDHRQSSYLQAEHQRILDEAADTLKVGLPRDIVIVVKNILPFLELPTHTFG